MTIYENVEPSLSLAKNQPAHYASSANINQDNSDLF